MEILGILVYSFTMEKIPCLHMLSTHLQQILAKTQSASAQDSYLLGGILFLMNGTGNAYLKNSLDTERPELIRNLQVRQLIQQMREYIETTLTNDQILRFLHQLNKNTNAINIFARLLLSKIIIGTFKLKDIAWWQKIEHLFITSSGADELKTIIQNLEQHLNFDK